MQLEDYFEFLASNDIRVRGTRIGIETILEDYLQGGFSAERIAARYPTLTLEQVYATLTYYCGNKAQVDAYLLSVHDLLEEQRREQNTNPSPLIRRVRELRAQQQATVSAEV